MAKKRKMQRRFWQGNVNDHFEYLRVDERIILECISKSGERGLDWSNSRQRPVPG